MAQDITPERAELGRCLDLVFESGSRSRSDWANALGVTRGAMWQWSDCRTVPRPEVWLQILEEAGRVGAPPEALHALLSALDVPLGRLGITQPSRKDETLLDEIVARASRALGDRVAALPFRDALDVLDGAAGQARRRERDGDWEQTLVTRFDRVIGKVVDTALGPEDSAVDRTRLGAAAWRAAYAWALASPDESITEGKVTRVVNDAVREVLIEWGGSVRFPTY